MGDDTGRGRRRGSYTVYVPTGALFGRLTRFRDGKEAELAECLVVLQR